MSRPMTNSAIPTAFIPAAEVNTMPDSARPADWSCAVPAPTACTHWRFGATSAASKGRSMLITALTRANIAAWASVSAGAFARASS